MQAVRSIAPDAAEAPAFCGSFIQQDRLSPASESRPTTALPPAPSPGPTQRGSGPVLDSSRSLCPHQDQARDQWCTIWCKTKCNKLSNPLQCSSSQPHSSLHGMQGVSGSSPLGSITSDSLRRRGSFCCTGSCWQARRGRKAQNRSPRMGPDLNGWTAQARARAMALQWSSS